MSDRIIDVDRLTRTFTRRYQEESDVSLSAIDCVLNGETAVYASTELTTGRRAHAVMREIGASVTKGLRDRLPPGDYESRIWDPNVREAMTFARRLHHSLGGNQIVITPGPFSAPGWNQDEYLAFWETLLRTRIHAVYFNDGWEFSNGCTFEFLVALRLGLPTFNATCGSLSAETAMRQITQAAAGLRADGIDAERLALNLRELEKAVAASPGNR